MTQFIYSVENKVAGDERGGSKAQGRATGPKNLQPITTQQ